MNTTNLALAQKMASLQGALFEQNCSVALECAGFEISGRHVLMKEIGIEVDIIATNQQGISFFITCKGSMRGDRPGARRTDTLKKALCDAFLLSLEGWTPVILMTSHVPDKGSGRAMLDAVPRSVLYDVVNPWNHSARLQWLAVARETEIQQDMLRSPQDVYAKNWQLTPSHPNAKLAFPKNAHMVERLLAEVGTLTGSHGKDTDMPR
ncbi:MAG: hypothetical protein U0X20_25980 [Caldilineaceae bacterium]